MGSKRFTQTLSKVFTLASGSVLGKIILSLTEGSADKSLTITNAALTDNRTITFPDATGTVALTSGNHTQNTDTGTTGNTFTVDSDSVTGKIVVDVALGAANKTLTITNAALTDDRTITFPDATGTVALTSVLHTQGTDAGTTGTDFTVKSAATTGKIKLSVVAGAADKTLTLTNAALTDNRTITFPDATGTVMLVPSAQTELTDELTTITHKAPSSADYAIADPVQNTGYGFSTEDEMLTALSVIANLQTRVNELETKLVALGLLVDAD